MNRCVKTSSRKRRSFLALGMAVWATAVMAGTLKLSEYAATPGPRAVAVATWPAGDAIARTPGRATLVMSVHPQCPCSRASVNELEVLIARCHGKLSAAVLFVDYPGVTSDLTTTELWQSASRIPDVTCMRDERGKLSDQFHAETSGQVFLYDVDGVLRFSGGITDSRGHAGDNDGLLAIEAIVNGNVPTTSTTPVFGCSLR